MLACNHQTGQWVSSEVKNIFANEYDGDTVKITLETEDGSVESVTATAGHPIWISSAVDMAELATRPLALEHAGSDAYYADASGGRYVNTEDLRLGDQLRLLDGRSATITGLLIRSEKLNVYNLNILKLHNYTVGSNGILAHNARTCGGKSGKGGNSQGRNYESNPKHRSKAQGRANPAPINPQKALDESIPLGGNTSRRIAVDKATGEFVVFDEHTPGYFHGYARSWSELS